MRKFLLNKLVRDKILGEMQAMGQQVASKKLSDAEYLHELCRKLVEEASEFKPGDPKEAVKELADVLEVVEALAAEFGADFDKLRAVQAERKAKRGGFATRTYVESVTLADDDPWAAYYAKEPDRFKEVKE